MSFYAVNVEHPTVEVRRSGQQAVGSDVWFPLSGTTLAPDKFYCPSGVWLKNPDASTSAYVRQRGSSAGTLLSPLEDRFFPVTDIYELEILGNGAPVTIQWHAC